MIYDLILDESEFIIEHCFAGCCQWLLCYKGFLEQPISSDSYCSENDIKCSKEIGGKLVTLTSLII